MTAERMGLYVDREQGLDSCPDGIDYLGIERAHDGGTSTWSWWVGQAPDHLGANPTAGGWSPALSREILTGPRRYLSERPLRAFPTACRVGRDDRQNQIFRQIKEKLVIHH
jgi:hypothetical protein